MRRLLSGVALVGLPMIANERQESDSTSQNHTTRIWRLCYSFILVFATLMSSSPSFGQTCIGVCGDADGSGQVSVNDMVRIVDWLGLADQPNLSSCANVDGCDLVTIRDLVWWKRTVFNGGSPFVCSTSSKYVPWAVPAYMTLYYHANIFPRNVSEVTITVLLDFPLWYSNIEGFSLPIKFAVDGEAPDIISVTYPGAAAFITRSVTNDVPGSVRLVGATGSNGVTPGTYQIARVTLGMPPSSTTARPVTLQWVELPPYMDGAIEPPNSPVNYAMVVDTNLLGYVPMIAGYLCGDVDENEFVTISDVVFLINYIFAGGPPPPVSLAADVSCDGFVSISDAVSVINFIFNGGSGPCNEC